MTRPESFSADPVRMRAELEAHNSRQSVDSPDAEWAIVELLAWLPLDVAGAAWRGMAKGLERAGYDAYFVEGTGLRVLWIRRRLKGGRT